MVANLSDRLIDCSTEKTRRGEVASRTVSAGSNVRVIVTEWTSITAALRADQGRADACYCDKEGWRRRRRRSDVGYLPSADS